MSGDIAEAIMLFGEYKGRMEADAEQKDATIASLQAHIDALNYALINISNALDSYGVEWCRSIALAALDDQLEAEK